MLVVGVEQDADPFAHRGTGAPERLPGDLPRREARLLVPDAPDERGRASDRVELHDGLGLTLDEQEPTLFEAAQCDGTVEERVCRLPNVIDDRIAEAVAGLARSFDDCQCNASGAAVLGRDGDRRLAEPRLGDAEGGELAA